MHGLNPLVEAWRSCDPQLVGSLCTEESSPTRVCHFEKDGINGLFHLIHGCQEFLGIIIIISSACVLEKMYVIVI